MDDLISRQAAIDAVIKHLQLDYEYAWGVREAINGLPSAQPDLPDTNVGDMISRQAAIDALARMMPRSYTPDGSHPADEEIFRAQEVFANCIEVLEILPSAQPEITLESAIDYLHKIGWMQEHDRVLTEYAQPDLDEWCTDCKEYDQEKHCCPRWNRVIRETLKDAQPERKKGKWERHFSRPNVYADLCWHCSVCGGSFAYDWANKWNFCPDCGAKMDGKEAEDE